MIKKNPNPKNSDLPQSRTALKQQRSKTVESLLEGVEESQRLSTILKDNVAQLAALNQALAVAAEGRARAEKALGDMQKRYHVTIDNLPVLVWEADPDKNRTYFNKRWLEFTGRGADQELGDGWLEGVHRDDRRKYVEAFRSALQRHENYSIEYRLRHHSGRYRWIFERGAPIFGLTGTYVVYVGGCIDIHDRKTAEAALNRSRQELRTLAARLQASQEEEKSQLAREIHDELSGTLTALKMDISLLPDRALKNQDLFLEKLQSMSFLIDQSLTRVQSIVSGLRPVVLDKFGLAAAIEWQTSEFQSRSGINCEIQLPKEELQLDLDRATAFFRIFQEALTNISRHAEATRVLVELKNQYNGVVLTVRDNGTGISAEKIEAPTSIGLLSMRERALSFGGVTQITSASEGGTLVSVRIPRKRTRPK